MKTTQELQAEIDELKNKIAKLEYYSTTHPNADWEPTGEPGHILYLNSSLEECL